MDNKYLRADATAYLAIEWLQKKAASSRNPFWEESFSRAADNVIARLRRCPETEAERPVLLGSDPDKHGNSALKLAAKALCNAKKTIKYRNGRRRPLDIEPAVKESHVDRVDRRLYCEEFVALANPDQQAVLRGRLDGLTDDEIANCLGLSLSHVAVIAYRGVRQIRSQLLA